MSSKILDIYITVALLACCMVLGIMGGVWSLSQGHHPMIAVGFGTLIFIICVGLLLIFCTVAGISLDVVLKVKNKKSDMTSTNKKTSIANASCKENPQILTDTITSELNFTSIEAKSKENRIKKNDKLKDFFKYLIENKVATHLASLEDAMALLTDIYNVIDTQDLEIVTIKNVKNHDLSIEDIYHLGFMVKYYLKKDNAFGAGFVLKAFKDEIEKAHIDNSTVKIKLSSNERQSHFIELPQSRLQEGYDKCKNNAADGDLEKDFLVLKA